MKTNADLASVRRFRVRFPALVSLFLASFSLVANNRRAAMGRRSVTFRGATLDICEIDLKTDDLRLFRQNLRNRRTFGSFSAPERRTQRSGEKLLFAKTREASRRARSLAGFTLKTASSAFPTISATARGIST
jgi:uncharacterized protein YigE (DUF2233 family)